MATSKAMPPQRSSSAAASASEYSIRSELERVGPGERNRLRTKKSKMQHPWHVQQQQQMSQMSEGVDDDDFDVAPGVAFGGGPLSPPLPRFGSAAVATQL